MKDQKTPIFTDSLSPPYEGIGNMKDQKTPIFTDSLSPP